MLPTPQFRQNLEEDPFPSCFWLRKRARSLPCTQQFWSATVEKLPWLLFRSIPDRLTEPVIPPSSCPQGNAPVAVFNGLYDKHEVMELLRISPRTYARYKSRGKIKTLQVGGRDYITPEAHNEALKESRRKRRI